MEIRYERGILISHRGEKLLLDPEYSSVPFGIPSIVSHAHSDHTAAMSGTGKTYVNNDTLQLFKVGQHQKRARNIHLQNFYEPFEIGPFEVEFIQAGHLLGASQIVVRNGNESIHYTGDFCPEDLLTVKKADVPRDIDVSIIDCTYGDKKIGFNSRDEIREKLFLWAIEQLTQNNFPLISVAKLGGAQEIIKLFNNLANNLPIFVTKDIAKLCATYENLGVSLDYKILDKETKFSNKCLVLIPRSQNRFKEFESAYSSLLTDKKVVRAIVTGQSAKFPFKAFDYSSALSTHASFGELISTVERISPSQVYTHYGFPESMAATLQQEYEISSIDFKECKGDQVADLIKNTKALRSPTSRFSSKNYIDTRLDEFL